MANFHTTFKVDKRGKEEKKPKKKGEPVRVLYTVTLKNEEGDTLTLKREDESIYDEFPPEQERDIDINEAKQSNLGEFPGEGEEEEAPAEPGLPEKKGKSKGKAAAE